MNLARSSAQSSWIRLRGLLGAIVTLGMLGAGAVSSTASTATGSELRATA